MKTFLATILLGLLLADPASAARGFGATFGTGSSDGIATGYSTALSTNYSIAAWINVHGSGGGGFGRVYDQANNANGDFLSPSGSTTVFQLSELWSSGQINWTFSGGLAADVWEHVCITHNASSTSNVPVVYVNGVSQTVIGTAVGTFTPGVFTMYVGNRNNTARNFDGKIAEFALYNGTILTASQCKALASGFSPLTVAPSLLTIYLPLYGQLAGEQDWGPSHIAETVTGAKFQPHPAIQPYPMIKYAQ